MDFTTAAEAVKWPRKNPDSRKRVFLLYDSHIWLGDKADAYLPVRRELT